ncbi:EAL domain-containing protein [Vibrio cortegadensis]|uniref:EAL domain-containing protein n=1 Tax=Vibrio cortegadensis TaxID=1328770 RepID=UPI0021C46585|nr:EAL domain-containing protein [Vibrio cortegadensis]MDN3697595.1 EAL domain-containing protein [Vibrio cortegadensis]
MRAIFFIFVAFCSFFASAQSKDVLIIHSYHQGFFWTDAFQSGLQSRLDTRNIPYRVVYLDTKRFQSAEYLEQLYQLYKTKFQNEEFQAIVVSDNNALNLMQRLSSELKNTPVIFGGINNYRPEMHASLNATGVTEDINLMGNILMIQDLMPDAEKITVISDHSVTGHEIRSQVDEFIEQNPIYKKKIEHYVPDTYEELLARTASFDRKNSILFWVYYRDINGWVSDNQQWKKLNQVASAPLFVIHDLGLGYGAVGGIMQSGLIQGKATGDLLLKVLGNLNQPLPAVTSASPEIKLDYEALVRWELMADDVEHSALLNKPETFFSRNQEALQTFGVVFIVMSIVIIFLVYYLRRIKNSEVAARKSQLLLESVFDQSFQYIGMLDRHGRLISSNSKLQGLFFHQGIKLDKPFWLYKHWQNMTAEKLEALFVQGQKSIVSFEADVWSQNKGLIILELSLKPMLSDDQTDANVLLEARDITSRKLTEDKLHQREMNLRTYYELQPVMMVTLDSNNRIQQVNQFTEKLLGYPQGKLLGQRLRVFYNDENAIIPRHVLLQPKQAMEGVWRREIQYRHADGHTIWVRENIRPLHDSGELLIVGEDISETYALSEKLEYQAQYDLLTNTYNRNHFDIELKKALLEVENHMRTHAMLFLDLDQLKVINDTAGHDAGDAAIKFCAKVLEEVLPYNSILSRMGGDEFAVLLKDCTEFDAIKVARNIISTLGDQVFTWEEIKLNLTCSIGVRLIDHTVTSSQMVHAQADTACHAAKEEGRNRFSLYHQDDEDIRRRQLEMECVNLVHNALAHDRLELFGQRILGLNLYDNQKMHFEILVRMKNHQGDYISPGIFIPASERYNIAHLIDKQVVTKTLNWLEAHPEAVADLGICSINLSGHSMGNQEFIDFLLHTLSASSVPCDKICLEITETAAMSNMNQAIEFFTRLKSLGCLIALDDFGSGLSSFGYLKKLPVDIVKIDGLFVRDMDVNETDYVMVRAINDLAKQMGKHTVAEFVENTKIIDKLLEIDVDFAQGYVIGRPKPLAELVSELSLEKAV